MEITNPTNQEVLVRASCFLQERQASFSKEDCDWYARQLSLYLNQWTMTDLLIHLNQPAVVGLWEQMESLLIRLSNFEPLQYITGQAEFYGREFIVSPDTLIPRPETEELVEKIITFLVKYSGGKVLEIGVGTGCIIHTLALECPDYSYQGVDISEGALEVAKKNKEKYKLNNVSLYLSDVFQEVSLQKFIAIISNPPYIDVSEKNVMDESVLRFEPELALFAEDKGLAIYRNIAENLENYLLEEGQAFFEIGFKQGKVVQQLFKQYCPNREVSIHKDLSGNDRMIIVGRRK